MATRGTKTLIADTLVGITFSGRQRRLPCLIQYSGYNIGRPYFLTEREMIIGRDPRAGIHIHEQKVSRQHAKLFYGENYVSIEDLKSRNGVFINGKKIVGITKLRDGAMITIGNSTFKYFKPGNAEQVFHDQLYRLATIDEKTQVFNDKYLASTLSAEIEISRTFKQNLSLIIYDLDHFKKVNDTFGHTIGDAILFQTARVASKVIRKNDILCRYGGEEFVVILRETDKQTAMRLAKRLCNAQEKQACVFDHKGKKVKLIQTISIGVASLNSRIKTVKQFIKAADQNLYKAKKAGRNQAIG